MVRKVWVLYSSNYIGDVWIEGVYTSWIKAMKEVIKVKAAAWESWKDKPPTKKAWKAYTYTPEEIPMTKREFFRTHYGPFVEEATFYD